MGTPGIPPSSIWQLVADQPLDQGAGYEFDTFDRSYLDSQNRGVQTLVLQALLLGIHATWMTLDGSSATVSLGDGVCTASSASGTVTRATSTALASAGGLLGLVLVAAAPGAKILVAVKGVIPPSITGITSGGPAVIMNNGRCEAVSSVSAGQYTVGTVDGAFFLTLNPIAPSLGGSGSGYTPGAPVYKSANFTIDSTMNGTVFMVDTTSNAVTATVDMTSLPNGFEFTLNDRYGQWPTHNCSVTSSTGTPDFVDPSEIGGTGAVATTVALSSKRATVRYKYDSGASPALFQVM